MHRYALDDHFAMLMDRHSECINSDYFEYIADQFMGGIDVDAAEAYVRMRSGLSRIQLASLRAYEDITLRKVLAAESFDVCPDASTFVRQLAAGFDPSITYMQPRTDRADAARALYAIWRDVQRLTFEDGARGADEFMRSITGHINAMGRALGLEDVTFARIEYADWLASRSPEEMAELERLSAHESASF